ncbi:MAG: FAD-dependent monooxygenase [Solirubrobacteraceae bacterium]
MPFDELLDPAVAAEAMRDNSTFLPDVAGSLCASHAGSCQALAEEAVRAGAQLVRGVAEVHVRAGHRPAITFRNGTLTNLRPRLIIGADGRTSTVRKQSGIHINAAPPTHVVAGLLVEGASRWPEDLYAVGVEGELQFYVFPQGHGRLRLYTCHATEQATRWAGSSGAKRFVEAFAGLRAIPNTMGLGEVTPAGPCATFSSEHTWCEKPYADGVVLIGDAGGYDDPVDGQGLSLALSDVRQPGELLLASDDWTAANLRPYGERRAERLRRMRRVSKTFAALMTTFTGRSRSPRLILRGVASGPRRHQDRTGPDVHRPRPAARRGLHRRASRSATGRTRRLAAHPQPGGVDGEQVELVCELGFAGEWVTSTAIRYGSECCAERANDRRVQSARDPGERRVTGVALCGGGERFAPGPERIGPRGKLASLRRDTSDCVHRVAPPAS